jgi:hypothetical protein
MSHRPPLVRAARLQRHIAIAIAALALSALAAGQQQASRPANPPGEHPNTQRITPNFKDADITQIIEAVSMATGKNFIIDPRVRAQVTMLSSTPMTPDQFYQAFLAILQVHGFRRRAGRRRHQDHPRRQHAPVPGQRPAAQRQLDFR